MNKGAETPPTCMNIIPHSMHFIGYNVFGMMLSDGGDSQRGASENP